MSETVLITGAGIGIGRATAKAFADGRIHVVVTDVLEKEGAAVADEIARGGRQGRVPQARRALDRARRTPSSPRSKRRTAAST